MSEWSPPFPCCPVTRQCPWKQTPMEKKNFAMKNSLFCILFDLILENVNAFAFSEVVAIYLLGHNSSQKQTSKSVLSKRCSENMQQINRITPMPKCDFNKVAFSEHFFLGTPLDGCFCLVETISTQFTIA